MRVVLLTNFIPPYRVPLYRALRDRVDELRIFIATPMEAERSWTPDWGDLPVTVEKTWSRTESIRHPVGFEERNAVHLSVSTLGNLRDFAPDVVISGELGFRSGLAAIYRRSHRSSRLVLWATVSERSEAGRGRLRRMLRRMLVPQADALIVNGESGVRYLAGLGGDPQRMVRMPYSMEPIAFSAAPVRDGAAAHRLLHIGQMIDRKGIRPLMQALVRHAEREPGRRVEIVFAGGGPLRDWLESAAWPENLSVRVLGHVAYERLRDLYADCGILAFPSLSDEWGMVVNEAFAAGLPVLGSIHAEAVSQLVQEGRNGWRLDPADPADLDRAVGLALSTPAPALDSMRQAAVQDIAAITPAAMADRMVAACRLARDGHPSV